MKDTPNRHDPNDRAQLARWLPAPEERDLPSDRQRLLQEFVMNEIQPDPTASPRPWWRRRLVLATSALAAAAAVTVAAVLIRTGTVDGADDPAEPVAVGTVESTPTTPTAALNGRQVLLAAATVARATPVNTGTYWYQKITSATASGSQSDVYEYWNDKEGRLWFRGGKTNGTVMKLNDVAPFGVSVVDLSFDQLQALPTEPGALKAWIADAVSHSGATTSAGPLNAAQRERALFEALVSLVCQMPAPPAVRAAALAAIAAYPNVESTGPVAGGVGLVISFPDEPANESGTERFQPKPAVLVIDPATSQVRRANWMAMPGGGVMVADPNEADPGHFELTCEWTDVLPQ